MSKFMEKYFGFKFYKNGKIQPFGLDEKLQEAKAMDLVYKLGLIEDQKGDSVELNKLLALLRQEKFGENLKPSFNDFALKKGGIENLVNEMSKHAHRLDEFMHGEKEASVSKVSIGQLLEMLGFYKDEKGVKLQELMDKNMDEILDIFSKLLKKATIKDFNPNFEVKDFARNIIKNEASRLTGQFGVFKTFAGLIFNLPMLIITCTALNWSYPRIVEALFPSLVQNKTPKGGNK